MVKITSKIVIIGLIIAGTFVPSVALRLVPHAQAAITPTFSIIPTGSSLQFQAFGDENAPVQLYYYIGGFQIFGTIGTTDSGGYFNEVLPNNEFNIASGVSVYVLIDGMQSPTIQWPYYSGNTGTLGTISTNYQYGYGYGNTQYYQAPSTTYINPTTTYVNPVYQQPVYYPQQGSQVITQPVYNQPTYYNNYPQTYYQPTQVVTQPVYQQPTYSYPNYQYYAPPIYQYVQPHYNYPQPVWHWL